jgi:hypothetical protein
MSLERGEAAELGQGWLRQLVCGIRDRRCPIHEEGNVSVALVAHMDRSAWPNRRDRSNREDLAAGWIAQHERESAFEDHEDLFLLPLAVWSPASA